MVQVYNTVEDAMSTGLGYGVDFITLTKEEIYALTLGKVLKTSVDGEYVQIITREDDDGGSNNNT